MTTRTQAIQEFLEEQTCKVDLYHPSMEVQVNVLRGERVKSEGKTPRWTDGEEVWSAFRIPFGGGGVDAEPYYRDGPLEWTLSRHVEAIGLTGWDWQNRLSRWVGFDFDSIINHSRGLSDQELDELRRRVKEIPWITLRRSKSGKGYHLYVSLETPTETRNHTEHSALAKAILSQLSGLLDFNFQDKVDTAGGVLWIWHREADESKQSFEVIKEATEGLKSVPPNWKDFIVLQRTRKRVPRKLADTEQEFNDLLSRTQKVNLDEEHRKLLNWFAVNDQASWWDAERGMLVCHTYALQKAHDELNLRGIFTTISTGRENPYDHNCFAFPHRGGAWQIFRYGLGTQESKYWYTSPSGWTTCVYNRLPDLASAARIYQGVKTKQGEYRFQTFAEAKKVLNLLGAFIDAPDYFDNRECTLAPGKAEMEIVVTVPYNEGDESLVDWYIEGKQKNNKRWERVVNAITEAKVIEPPDEVVRHVTRPSGKPAWFVLSRGRWVEKGKDDIKSALNALDYNHHDREKMLGMAVLEHWEEVIEPFAPEYPGSRKWNREAPQFAFDPEHGPHPTWDLILQHIGSGLDVEGNEWCRVNGVNTGSDYLKLWIASMLRHPFEHLPYLFLWSEAQNTGKSTLHEAIRLIFKDGLGYAKADRALTNDSGFNGELYGTILAVVEEVDVSSKIAYDRAKDWVTSEQIFIRPLHRDGFLSANSTHWIQCSNNKSYCPVFPGDTRITVGYVPEFTEEEIPKPELMSRLLSEGPAFLYTLLRLDIPPSNSRLRIPVLDSSIKQELEDLNRNAVVDFIEAECSYTPGTVIDVDLFVSQFLNWLSPSEQTRWGRDRILKEIPVGKFPKGIYSGRLHLGNLTVNGVQAKHIKQSVLTKRGRKLE